MTLSRKERLEQARAQVGDQKALLETFEGGRRDLSVDSLRDHDLEAPAMSAASIAPASPPAPVVYPTSPRPFPVLTADGAVVPSVAQGLVNNPAPLGNPLAPSASASAMISVVDQMRSAAKSFDRWRVTRHHIGVRVMQQSKARLRRITKRLGVRSMGAALDYLLADAEQRLFGVVREDG